jgi:hypothetical protein
LQCLYQFKDDKSESGWSAFDVRELSKQAPWFIDKSAGHAEQILQASIKAEDAGISLRDWLLAYEVNLFSYWEEE